jgi:dTDP-4-dehydrorhamnose reductase
MLGRELARLRPDWISAGRAEFDIADPAAYKQPLREHFGPLEAVINAAAYTAVDRAETEPEPAFRANAKGPALLAEACAREGIPLYHVSTDFVFDGAQPLPYSEDDPINPLGVYGQSKAEGERAVLGSPQGAVVRTAWLFGAFGPCFPKSILRAARAGRALRVVADQRGNPTYAADLAAVLANMVEQRLPGGVYHAVGPEPMSWHAFAQRVLQAFGMPILIEAISTHDWPTPAKRPANSVLGVDRLTERGLLPMPNLDSALQRFRADLKQDPEFDEA